MIAGLLSLKRQQPAWRGKNNNKKWQFHNAGKNRRQIYSCWFWSILQDFPQNEGVDRCQFPPLPSVKTQSPLPETRLYRLTAWSSGCAPCPWVLRTSPCQACWPWPWTKRKFCKSHACALTNHQVHRYNCICYPPTAPGSGIAPCSPLCPGSPGTQLPGARTIPRIPYGTSGQAQIVLILPSSPVGTPPQTSPDGVH